MFTWCTREETLNYHLVISFSSIMEGCKRYQYGLHAHTNFQFRNERGKEGRGGGGKEGGMERVERERRTEAGLTITRIML